MAKYYQIDVSGVIFKYEKGMCSYLSKDGKWIEHPPLFGKLVGGDSDFEEISEEKVEQIIAKLTTPIQNEHILHV